jgi:hypothetical protein
MAGADAVATAESCGRCRAALDASAYEVRTDEGTVLRCFRCAVTHGPLMRRSLIVALVVGTLLTAINQGNLIASGDFPADLAWKVPLTYAVPYCVTTTGAILNARRRLREMEA